MERAWFHRKFSIEKEHEALDAFLAQADVRLAFPSTNNGRKWMTAKVNKLFCHAFPGSFEEMFTRCMEKKTLVTQKPVCFLVEDQLSILEDMLHVLQTNLRHFEHAVLIVWCVDIPVTKSAQELFDGIVAKPRRLTYRQQCLTTPTRIIRHEEDIVGLVLVYKQNNPVEETLVGLPKSIVDIITTYVLDLPTMTIGGVRIKSFWVGIPLWVPVTALNSKQTLVFEGDPGYWEIEHRAIYVENQFEKDILKSDSIVFADGSCHTSLDGRVLWGNKPSLPQEHSLKSVYFGVK